MISKSKTCHICYDENIKKNYNKCVCKKGIIVCENCMNSIENINNICVLCKTSLRNNNNTKICNCNCKITNKYFRYLILIIGYVFIPYLFSYILFLLYCDTTCNIIIYYNDKIRDKIFFLLWNWIVGVFIILLFFICWYKSDYEN